MNKEEDKNRIFELFVANFCKLHLRGWDVSAQERRHWVKRHERTDTGVRLPTMYPDVVLSHKGSGAVVIIDTKWYGSVLSDRYGRPTVNRDHVFQMYAYLESLDRNDQRFGDSTGILLYARTETDVVDFRTEIHGHPFWVETLDLMQEDWKDIEADLLRLIEETVGDV